jgi:hypothetical protein
VGALHGLGNAVALLLFLGSWLLRSEGAPPPWGALLTSLLGGGLMIITAWLGGELVSRLGVGVYEDAHVNASSSLIASEATPSPEVPSHIGQAPPPPPGRTRQGPSQQSQKPAPRPSTAAADLSVAGEEDPGAAIDTTDMAPVRRGKGPRR